MGQISKPSEAFRGVVLSWLRSHGGRRGQAASVVSVEATGWDYPGNPEDTRDPAFSVEIAWLDPSGKPHTEDVEGDALESLWEWIAGAWPETSPAGPLGT